MPTGCNRVSILETNIPISKIAKRELNEIKGVIFDIDYPLGKTLNFSLEVNPEHIEENYIKIPSKEVKIYGLWDKGQNQQYTSDRKLLMGGEVREDVRTIFISLPILKIHFKEQVGIIDLTNILLLDNNIYLNNSPIKLRCVFHEIVEVETKIMSNANVSALDITNFKDMYELDYFDKENKYVTGFKQIPVPFNKSSLKIDGFNHIPALEETLKLIAVKLLREDVSLIKNKVLTASGNYKLVDPAKLVDKRTKSKGDMLLTGIVHICLNRSIFVEYGEDKDKTLYQKLPENETLMSFNIMLLQDVNKQDEFTLKIGLEGSCYSKFSKVRLAMLSDLFKKSYRRSLEPIYVSKKLKDCNMHIATELTKLFLGYKCSKRLEE